MWQLTFAVVDLLTLKLMMFSLVIAYFGTPRLHQIAPDHTIFIKVFPGEHAPHPPSTSWTMIVTVYLCTCYVILFLDNKLIFIRKLKNADQIYTYFDETEV